MSPRVRQAAGAVTVPLVVVGVTLIALALSLATTAACLGLLQTEPGPPRCTSDITGLFALRALGDHVFPFLHPGSFGLPQGTVEYPVLTGVFAWFTALAVDTRGAYYLVTAIALSVVACVTAWQLGRLNGWRALLFAASPVLVLHAFQNWDLLPVAASVAGLAAWTRGRPRWAAFWFGVGACLKIYPALFLLPLYAEARSRGGHLLALRTVAPAVAVALVVNVPLMLHDVHLWWEPFAFQQLRPVDASALSVWSTVLSHLTLPLVNALASLALLLGVAVVMAVGTRRFERDGAYPVVQVCAALVCVWLLTAKASSPQFMLWVLPFFVLLRTPLWLWVAATLGDLACQLSFKAWFDAGFQPGGFATTPGALPPSLFWVDGAVMFRALVLVVAVIVFLRAGRATSGGVRGAADVGRGQDVQGVSFRRVETAVTV